MNNLEEEMRQEMKVRGYRMYKKIQRREMIKVGLQMFATAFVVYILAILILAIW